MSDLPVTDFVERSLAEHRTELETVLDADVIAYFGPIRQPLDEALRDAIEGRNPKRQKLCVMLETGGGSVEVTRRCVDTMRYHYPDYVEFIVPNYAYSAGTIMCLSGNEIRMDYFSVLGPIDPQLRIGADFVPAWGYVEHYNDLIKKAQAGTISKAETSMLISGFDYAQLHQIKMFRELSVRLLKEWLPKYKFADWNQTEKTKRAVTTELKKKRAASIAKKLSDTKLWNSHGHGISREVMERDVGVKIFDYATNAEMNEKIKAYHGLAIDYMRKMGYMGYMLSQDSARVLWRKPR